MIYAKIVGTEITYYPSSLGYLVAQGVLDTDTPTPEQLAAANVVEVARTTESRPIDGYKYTTKPVQQNGTWVESWVRLDTSNAEFESNKANIANAAIQCRNALLANSDWTQMSDVPLTNKAEWVTYRQALRDLPLQSGFPFSIEWPTQPKP
jgi:Phage tail assembly chaperone protein